MSLRKCAQCLGVWDLGFLDSNRVGFPCPGFPISARQEGHTWKDSLGGGFALGEYRRAPRKSLRSDSCSFIVQLRNREWHTGQESESDKQAHISLLP